MTNIKTKTTRMMMMATTIIMMMMICLTRESQVIRIKNTHIFYTLYELLNNKIISKI